MARTAAGTTDHAPTAARGLTPEEAGLWLSDLFEAHGRMVYGVCRILLRDPQEAEDASQQTFLSAHRSLLAGTRPRDPAAWLGTIARNECRERIRARATAPLALVGEQSSALQTEDVTGRREEIEALCAALAELPQQQREAIVLREFYGLSYDEVRAALGVSGSAVESLIFRARKRLQKELRPARAASGALALPVALHTSLAHAVPGFAGAHRAGILAKLAGAPIAAKLAAATVAVTVAGVVGTTAVERHRHATPAPRPSPIVAAKPTVAPPAGVVDLVSDPSGSTEPSDPAVTGGKHGDGDGPQDAQGGTAAGNEDQPADAQQDDQGQTSTATDGDSGTSSGNQDDGDSGNTNPADDSSGNNRSSDPSSGDSDTSGSSSDGNG